MSRLFNFVFTFSTPYMITGTGKSGWGTFLFYAIFDLIMAAWVFFFVHEVSPLSQKVTDDIETSSHKSDFVRLHSADKEQVSGARQRGVRS